jgi:outer membrane murein-binding lipoprotein Lpp
MAENTIDPVNKLKHLLQAALDFADHHRGLVVGLVIAVALISWISGCDSTTTHLGQTVNRAQLDVQSTAFQGSINARVAQLEADITAFNAGLDAANADLDKQDELKAKVIDIAGGLATTAATGGTVNAAGLIASIIGAGGLLSAAGMGVDRARASKRIKELSAATDNA